MKTQFTLRLGLVGVAFLLAACSPAEISFPSRALPRLLMVQSIDGRDGHENAQTFVFSCGPALVSVAVPRQLDQKTFNLTEFPIESACKDGSLRSAQGDEHLVGIFAARGFESTVQHLDPAADLAGQSRGFLAGLGVDDRLAGCYSRSFRSQAISRYGSGMGKLSSLFDVGGYWCAVRDALSPDKADDSLRYRQWSLIEHHASGST